MYCDYCDSDRGDKGNCAHCGAPSKAKHERKQRTVGGPYYLNGLVYFVSSGGFLDQYIEWIVYDRDGVCSRVRISRELREQLLSEVPEGCEILEERIVELVDGGATRPIRWQSGGDLYTVRLEKL